VHLHVERQTLRRLPKSKDILFTIRTYLTPVADIILNDRVLAEQLAAAVRAWPPEVEKYKVPNINYFSCFSIISFPAERGQIQTTFIGVFGQYWT